MVEELEAPPLVEPLPVAEPLAEPVADGELVLGELELELELDGADGEVVAPEPAEPLPDMEPLAEPLEPPLEDLSVDEELEEDGDDGVVDGEVVVEDDDEPAPEGERRLASSPQAARPRARPTATAMVESFIQASVGWGT